jgi:hypothetical protein
VVQQTDRVLAQFESQARACDEMGSPFTARLCRILATRLDTRTRFGRAILEWEGDPFADNIALRACGALHALARSGWEPNVTAVYPPAPANDHSLWIAIADALGHNDAFLTDRLKSAPQTNEVARSATILGGMLHIANVTKQPLELFEIGASAGLNLGFDAYRYDLGNGRSWGPLSAPLTIASDWRGHIPPLAAPLSVVARHGCDLHPIDAGKAEDRERLLSYVWADQPERLHRVEAALDIAVAQNRKIDKADAADWVAQQLATPQRQGTTRVLFHTIVWQYIPAAAQARIDAAITKAAAAATLARPFARLSFEGDDVPGSGRLDLSLWPGKTITLGRAHYHGRWTEWGHH